MEYSQHWSQDGRLHVTFRFLRSIHQRRCQRPEAVPLSAR